MNGDVVEYGSHLKLFADFSSMIQGQLEFEKGVRLHEKTAAR